MDKNIFRKESIDRISSPEQMDDYIRVASPRAFLMMAAIVILLIGICVWGVFGRLETGLKVCAVNGENGLCLYVPETEIGKLPEGAEVMIGEERFEIAEVSKRPVPAGEAMDAYAMHVGGLHGSQWVYRVSLHGSMGEPGEVYMAEIELESVSPLSFVFN